MNHRELVGIAEIATMAGITRQQVDQWTKRKRDMPLPLVSLRCGRVWDKSKIQAWLIKIGYITDQN